MREVRRALQRHSFLFALVLGVALLLANIGFLPSFVSVQSLPKDFGLLAPAALAAMATTPSVVGGGLDISVAPLMDFVSVVFALGLLPHGLGAPQIAIPICLAIGGAVGALNGVTVAVLRYQPIIATLATFFVLSGVSLALAPTASGIPPNWTQHLSGSIGPLPGGLVVVAAVAFMWAMLRKSAFYRALYAVGSDDAVAFSAGVNVTAVKVLMYALGGLFAAVGGLALVGLVQSADPTYGTQYVLPAIAGVALGGTALGGGRGGLLGSLLGGLVLYEVENLLLAADVNALWVQVVYGGFLIAGVLLGPLIASPARPEAAR